MALVAILFGSLGDFVAYLLNLPEWRLPREYNRAEYDPAEFCVYLIRWVLESYDTTFWFFGLLGLLVHCAIKFWQYCQRSRHAQEPLDAAISLSHEELDALMGGYLEEIFGDAGGQVEDMGSVARATIAALQICAKDSETRCNDAQDTIADLQSTNKTLRDHETELVARLYAQRQTFSSVLSENTALQSQNSTLEMKLGAEQEEKQREVVKASNAAAKMDAQIKHLSAEAATWKQRAEEAEQALLEKDSIIRTASQEQQQLESRFKSANERIEKLEGEAEERMSKQEALRDDLNLKSSTIESLEVGLKLASVEITEAKEIAQLVESEKWHVYAKMQEAWILEDNTTMQDQLEQAKLDIQFLEVALEGLAEEHKAALEEKDKALASQRRQYEEAVRNADVDLSSFSDAESVRGLDIDELETERSAEEGSQGAKSKRSRRKKGGRMHQARNYVKHIQRQLDYALAKNDGSTNAVDNVRSLQAQLNQAWEATRRKVVSDAPTEP